MGERSDILDDTFSALAHPTRRKMMELLTTRDLCVTELAAHFPDVLNVISKHIKYLERAGLVKRQRQGRVHSLHLDSVPLDEASAFIERYRKRWERHLDRLGQYMDELKRVRTRNAKSKSKTS
jgi:DNA-binding transcriptional ArsR family regulator